jgi:hypothetical protein
MSGEIVVLRDRAGLSSRLQWLVGIFETIDSRELLAALPDCPLARESHLAALDLLATAEAELRRLCEAISPESTPRHLDVAASS